MADVVMGPGQLRAALPALARFTRPRPPSSSARRSQNIAKSAAASRAAKPLAISMLRGRAQRGLAARNASNATAPLEPRSSSALPGLPRDSSAAWLEIRVFLPQLREHPTVSSIESG